MPNITIPDNAIEAVTKHINQRNNKNYQIPVTSIERNIETPQYFEILPFTSIDDFNSRFYAIDGSYNSEQFYNGLAIGIYTAGYVCFKKGEQIKLNSDEDPTSLGKIYVPQNILVTNQDQLFDIYDELFSLPPVMEILEFWDDKPEQIFPYNKESTCKNLSTLLSFCQELLEIALIYEIAKLCETKKGDFILRDGTLRPVQIKQKYLVKLGSFLQNNGIFLLSVTKQSPIKMELSYTFKQIDNYLQENLIKSYPFQDEIITKPKLCCWFEVPMPVLQGAYKNGMFIKKDISGGRGCGLFFATRLDYVEKLQNYDWLIVDINIFDAIPKIESGNFERATPTLQYIFKELTRLTQEHYILGYPYPLVEAHNLISLKRDFKEELIKRLKYSLYKDQRMDNVDIENLFLDTHDRF